MFVITKSSRKRYRMSIVLRMHNLALGIVEAVYRANDVFVSKGDAAARSRRLEHQNRALTNLRLLSYLGELGMTEQCILKNQFENLSRLINACQSTLLNWMASDRKRFEQA